MILVTLLVATTLMGHISGCSDPFLQACTNCAPGPDCPSLYDFESPIPQSSHCETQCGNDTTCVGSWFKFSPGQLGRCAYYNCSQVQQQNGFTYFRKSCSNDSECLSYEILRYEGERGQCIELNPSLLPALNTSSEYECLEACLDAPGCRAVTFQGVQCTMHSCQTSTPEAGYVFWRKKCHEACANETLQRCLNCGPSADCQAPYYNMTGLVPSQSCGEECESRPDCRTSYYSVSESTCDLYDCNQIDMAVNMVSSRKACYAQCNEYEIFELADTTANCTPYASETSGTTAHTCLNSCLDSPTCMSVSFDQGDNNCYFYTCTDRIAQSGSVFYWRNCLDPCARSYTAQCIDCDASPSCKPMSIGTESSSVNCDNLCNSTQSCNMAVFKPIENACYLYECSDLQNSFGNTAYRHTCNTDCLHYKIEILTTVSVTCPVMGEDEGGVDLSFCMARCLDMIGCRAVTFYELTKSCQYHNCSDVASGISATNQTIVRRICVDEEPPRNYTQECLNCDVNSATCPLSFDAPLNYISTNCDGMCQNTTGCTTAVFNYGQCLLYDCKYVTQVYGVTAFRRTYNPDCLRFKIDIKHGYQGTCPTLSATAEYPDYTYCLAGCLDHVGCMGVTYDPFNQTCWFHSCNASVMTVSSVGLIFVERQCNPEVCERLYDQECVNCDIHERSNWAFSNIADVALTSNCSTSCSLSASCGASVYNPTQSRCKLYNQTGLRVAWGKTATRQSCRSDCPKFKLNELRNKTGICSTLETHDSIPTLDDCVQLCLDLTGCLGTTFYELTLTCTLHDCGNRTNSGTDPTMFVLVTCDVEECAKVHTQTCMNCRPGPNCQLAMSETESFSLTHECQDRCNSSNCLASYFDMPEKICYTLNCGQVMTEQRYHRVYRKSCTSDCPIYEIYTDTSLATNCVDIGDSGDDKIPNVHYCMETCLDIENCRVVNYNSTTRTCTYHSQCTDIVANMTGHYYGERICVEDDPPVGDLIQTCHNCGIGPDCQGSMSDSMSAKYFDYECETFCLTSPHCRALHYNSYYSACYTYQCTQVEQKIGHTVYRRTNNTDCLEFELFTYENSAGNCSVIGQYTRSTGPEFCMDICLDLEHCRGITYVDRDELCYFHNCTEYKESKDNTFMMRVCSQGSAPGYLNDNFRPHTSVHDLNTRANKFVLPDPDDTEFKFDSTWRFALPKSRSFDFDVCERNETQTCMDCSSGPTCQAPFGRHMEFLPRNVDTSMIGTDSNFKQIWYDADRNRSKNMYCSEVDMAVGQSVHRATCVNDCPKFKIFIHSETVGNCSTSTLSTISGGISLHYCINKCLDIVGCRAINYDNLNTTCDLYGECNMYTQKLNHTFFRRTCIDEATECVPNTLQTCLNCEVSEVCQDEFKLVNNTYFFGECYDLKTNEGDSDSAWFDRTQNQCKVYQCDLVDFNVSNTVYRDSCDQDCTEYELFRKYDVEGTCDVIGVDAGSVTIQYCIQRCIDMTGCRGVTFYGNVTLCNYHNCSDTSVLLPGMNTTFIERRCVTEECIRNYTQVCLNCKESASCQSDFSNLPNYATWEECFDNTVSSEHAGLITYYEKSGSCQAINCSLVYQDSESVVLRKSCASDCPIYRIATLNNYDSTCPVIGRDQGGVTTDYCLSRCLDMPGCRAISFTTSNNTECLYHSCADKVAGGSTETFIWRVCIDETQQNVLEPIKPYTQKCLNCGIKCFKPIASQSGVTRDTDCDVTCPGCDMVWYNPVTETCFQYGCDRLYAPLAPSVMFLTTNTSDCLEYEAFFYTGRQATCDVIHYEEGLNDVLYCLRHCMDVPGCRSVSYQFDTKNCTFFGCNNHTTGTVDNWFLERVCTDETDHVLQSSTSCATPTFQTCVNCDVDASLCQSPYSTTSTTEPDCLLLCEQDTFCEAAVYSSGTCTTSQCDVVTPGNDSSTTLYRKVCFSEDCPVFEVHQLSNHFGVCDIMRTEEIQFNPGLCFERCLRMPGCRGVTFWTRFSKCLYHSCDCSYSFVDPGHETVFMWRYCLSDVSAATLLTNVTSPPKEFPDCHSTTTVSTTTISTTTTISVMPANFTTGVSTIAVSTITANSTLVSTTAVAATLANTAAPPTISPNLTNIYLRSCLCSQGLFGNLTIDEITAQLIRNLTIDKDDTGASKRRYISIVDNRKSAITIGSAGVVVLILEFSSLVMIDSSRILQAIHILYGHLKTLR